MDPRTGDIHYFNNEMDKEEFEKRIGRQLIPLTEEQAEKLKPILPKKRIKFLMKNSRPCVCGSQKPFKKCCWRKYKKQLERKTK